MKSIVFVLFSLEHMSNWISKLPHSVLFICFTQRPNLFGIGVVVPCDLIRAVCFNKVVDSFEQKLEREVTCLNVRQLTITASLLRLLNVELCERLSDLCC